MHFHTIELLRNHYWNIQALVVEFKDDSQGDEKFVVYVDGIKDTGTRRSFRFSAQDEAMKHAKLVTFGEV